MFRLIITVLTFGLSILVCQIKAFSDDSITRDYINTWLVLGTFDNSVGNSGYKKDIIGEATVIPTKNKKTHGKTWQYFDDRLFSRNYDDYQDLYSYFKIKHGDSVAAKVVYANVYVYSNDRRKVKLSIGADNEFKAWLNGKLVSGSTKSNHRRDNVFATCLLKRGWNQFLMKIANQEDGRLGFYACFSDLEGHPIPGLIYSVNNPQKTKELSICTMAMDDIKTGNMPVGWREWPYVGAHPDLSNLPVTDETFLLRKYYQEKKDIMMGATDFRFLAQGGIPPYTWTHCAGELPPGLTLLADGRIVGTISPDAELRNYTFIVRIRDAESKNVEKKFDICVKERPNKWVEEIRLDALVHGPESVSDAEISKFVNLMKAQGYGLIIPIAYNNGDGKFRWPSRFDPDKSTPDTIGKFKKAIEDSGMAFGMYMGHTNMGDPKVSVNQSLLMVEEAILKYHPRAFWFDWGSTPEKLESNSADALYSMIRSYDPNIVIILNGPVQDNSDDWDIVSQEGWGAWGNQIWEGWPVRFNWPKKNSPESWRLIVEPEFSFSKGINPDWKEYLKIQISLIGEGFIANMDHSLMLAKSADKDKPFFEKTLVKTHKAMADWANPAGIPPLYTSYTRVNQGPLKGSSWGYNLINTSRDVIYMHILSNPKGKTGLPPEPTMTVSPIDEKVKSVIWMNKNKTLPFTQANTSTNKSLTIDISGVSADDVDTIFEIKLETPLPEKKKPIDEILLGNLAYKKHAKLLTPDGKKELPPSCRWFYAQNGVDGNMMSCAAASDSWAWIYEVDLERPYNVGKIIVFFPPNGFPTQYKVEASDDGKIWKQLTYVNDNSSGGKRMFEFQPCWVRYIRICGIKPDGPDQKGGQMNIAELQVYKAE